MSILMYTRSWCGDCHRAKRLLDDFGFAYEEIELESQPEKQADMEAINGGKNRVPTILFADQSILIEPSNAQLAAKVGIDLNDWA